MVKIVNAFQNGLQDGERLLWNIMDIILYNVDISNKLMFTGPHSHVVKDNIVYYDTFTLSEHQNKL